MRYRPEGEQNPKSWGQIDVDVQGRDGETEIINGHFLNGNKLSQNWNFFKPEYEEFGLRNTEFPPGHIFIGNKINGMWTF